MNATRRWTTPLLLGTLALASLPIGAHAVATSPATHPWKAALARRMAQEPMEHREAREEREEARRRLELARRQGLRPAGDRARPSRPETLRGLVADPAVPNRRAVPFGASAFTPPTNRIVNNRAGDVPDAGQSETAIVAFGNRMVAAWNDGQGFQTFTDTQGWATSSDGGLTWVDQGAPPRPLGVNGFQWTSDPVLTVNEKSGAVYYAGLCDFSDAQGLKSGVALIKGRWNGNTFTWGAPVVARSVDATLDFLDKQWIVADSVSGRVHLTYSRFPSSLSRIEYQSADSALAAFTTAKPISLDTPTENGWVQGSRPIVDGDGRLYVMYYLIGQQELDYYRVCRSVDGGATFTSPVNAISFYANFGTGCPAFNRAVGIQFAGLAVDRSHGPNRGRLYLSWAESINWLDDLGALGTGTRVLEREPNDNAASANPIVVGQQVNATLSSLTDVDLFAVPLLAGQHLLVAADSTGANGELSLRLLAGDGVTRLTFTTFDPTINPSASGAPSGWLFTAPASGTYYVRVGARTGSGSYHLATGFADRVGERGRDQRDVFVAASDDGVTWSTPSALSDDAVGFDAFLPEVAVAADGGAYAAWFDYRDAPTATNGGQAAVYLARSGDGGVSWTTLGAVSDTLSNWTAAVSNIEPNQGDYLSLFANGNRVWPCWSDARRGNPDVFVAAVPLIANGAQVAFVNAQVGPKQVTIDWSATPADTLTMRLYRSVDGGAFGYVSVVRFAADGTLSVTDTTVSIGHDYSYRLGRFQNGIELFYGQVTVRVPTDFPLALSRVWPNPLAQGDTFTADLSIGSDAPVELTLYDLAGREVLHRTERLGLGQQQVTFTLGSHVRQGLYVLQARQNGRSVTRRLHIAR
jgi:hypothetical protein